MKNQIYNLIIKLKEENQQRSDLLNSGTLSNYNHTAKVHIYNNTLDIIKQLEDIIKYYG